MEAKSKDAGYYEILSNVPGKQQEDINVALLKIWGEVENWYGDPKKLESGRQFLLRLQKEFNISYANRIPDKFATIDNLHEQTAHLTTENQRLREALEAMVKPFNGVKQGYLSKKVIDNARQALNKE